MAGIKIAIVEDVSSFLRGTERAEDALDEFAGSLDDVARDAQNTGEQLGDGFTDGARQAEDATERMERSFRDLSRSASRTGEDVGDELKAGYREAERAAERFEATADDATDEASEASSEFKDEARANFAETAASFSGDFSSAADAVQGTLGGLAGSLAGPAGLAAGALAIIGGTLLSSIQANAEKAEQRISDMYDDFLESGADFLSKEYVAEQLAAIYQGADDAAIKVAELRRLAETAEIPEPLLARALVGDQAARDEVTRLIGVKRLEITDALDDATARGENLAPTFAPAIQALIDVEDQMSGVAGQAAEAQRNADKAAEAIRGIDAGRAAASAEEARSKFDGLGRRIETLPKVASVKVEVDDSEVTEFVRGIENAEVRLRVQAQVTGQRVV